MVTRRTDNTVDDVQPLRQEQLALPWLDGVLSRVLAGHRGHALLVWGQAGAGALELALQLSQAWLCEVDAAGTAVNKVARQARQQPCGHCGSCRLFLGHTHPDFKIRVPEALALARGFPVSVDERRKPSRQIRIDEVRDAIDWMATTTGRGQGKVLVVHPAEAMNAAAASALLKTLEEPPPGARVVLTTADPGLLMPTIVSRCQLVRLPLPEIELALDWLQQQGVEEGGVLLDGAGGLPLTALQWSREGLTAQVWRLVPRAVAAGDPDLFRGWPVRRWLDAMQKLCHDAGAKAVGGLPRFFPADQVLPSTSLASLTQWYKQLQSVMQHAEHPWSEPLLLEALLAEGRLPWEASAVRHRGGTEARRAPGMASTGGA